MFVPYDYLKSFCISNDFKKEIIQYPLDYNINSALIYLEKIIPAIENMKKNNITLTPEYIIDYVKQEERNELFSGDNPHRFIRKSFLDVFSSDYIFYT